MSAIIEGTLVGNDESSSDSDGELDVQPRVLPAVSAGHARYQNDDEEEIEYFQPSKNQIKQASASITESAKPAAKKTLLDVIPTVKDDTNEDNGFGITYKPHKKPAAPVEVVEDADFDVLSNKFGKNRDADNDDEFDFECTISSENAISTAIQEASKRSEIINVVTEVDVNAEKDVAPPGVEEEIIDIRMEAKKAFSEISEIYGSGMGDQEVLLLDAKVDDRPLTQATGLASTSRNIKDMAIAEGDEEEEGEKEDAVRREAAASNPLLDEWRNLEKASTATSQHETVQSQAVMKSELSYKRYLSYLRSVDLGRFEALITVSEESSGSSWFSKPKQLQFLGSVEELKFPFLLAQLDYDGADPNHLNILRGVYKSLLGLSGEEADAAIPAVGPHWETIGFQGVDPRTDLNRSMKMLTLLQMTNFLSAQGDIARKYHRMSGSSEAVVRSDNRTMDNTWPFMCVSISFTKEALQALRSGVLNEKCNKRKSVLSVLHDFHHACFVEFGRLQQEQPAVHHAVHLAALRKRCEKEPLKLLKVYEQFNLQASNKQAAVGSGEKQLDMEDFDTFESMEKGVNQMESESRSWSNIFGGTSKASKFLA